MLKRNAAPLFLVALLAVGLVVSGLAFARSVEVEDATIVIDLEMSRDIPGTVWFQGFLADGTTGDPITATYDIVARMYDHATVGGLEWGPESHNGTTITEGWFNIELGSSVTLPAFDDPPYYLQLWIDGEMMEPRLKIASVPTALRSGTVDVILPYAQVVNSTVPGIQVSQNGTGAAGWFEHSGGSATPTLYARHSGSAAGVFARNMGTGPALKAQADGAGAGVLAINAGAGSALHAEAQGTGLAAEFDGEIQVTATDTFAARFSSATPGAIVIESRYTGPDNVMAAGIYSEVRPDDGWGFGGVFNGGMAGIYSFVDVLPLMGGGIGVVGECTGGEGTSNNTGVYGYAYGGADNYGVVGEVGGGPRQENWAGYFMGDVYAEGYWGPVVQMKIDHPINPADEYLSHAYVASDEMKTVYDGSAVLDGSGSAWVELPDWFEALNGDFRYQLTPIGAAAPNLHIASAIAGNRFAIGGGEPGMEVSWQVTGVRHDAVAEARRTPVESAKLGDKQGKYMHPEAFGLPETMATDYSEERERAKETLREKFHKGR